MTVGYSKKKDSSSNISKTQFTSKYNRPSIKVSNLEGSDPKNGERRSSSDPFDFGENRGNNELKPVDALVDNSASVSHIQIEDSD